MTQPINENKVVVDASDLAPSSKKETIHVLHVDDDSSMLEISKQILILDEKFEIDSAQSVDEALHKIATRRYDIVVSDFEMPVKDGLMFLKQLHEQKNEIPFILFTGKGREEVAIKALNLGADGYYNKQGSPEVVYGELSHAITFAVKRKKAEQEILEQKLKAERYLNVVGNIVLALDLQGKITLLNKKGYEILGYKEGELTGKDWIETCLPEEKREELRKILESWVKGKEAAPKHYENLVVTKQRETKLISWHNTEVKDNAGRLIGTLSSGEDITERKKAEQTLLESEAKYRELSNSMPNIVYECDKSGKVDFINDRALEIAGISNEDFKKGMNIMQFLVPEDRDRATKSMQRLFDGGKYEPAEYLFLRKDGSTFPALIATTLRTSKNKITGLRGLVIDIAERKKSEEIIRKSEVRYRELANLLPEIVFETDLTGKVIFFSQRATEVTGFTREDLENGLNMLSFVIPEERAKAKENLVKALSGKGIEGHEYTLLKKNGVTFPAIVKTSPIISENKIIGLRGVVIDITERKFAEQKLLAASLYSRSLIEANLDPLITFNKEGKITDVNKATEEVTGLIREDLVGTDFYSYFTDPEEAKKGYLQVFREKIVKDYPLTIKHKSGKLTDVLYNASIYYNSQCEIQGAFAAARDVTESKKAKDALKQEQEKLENVTENIGAGLTLIGRDFHILWANNYLEKINGPLENKICFSTFNVEKSICPDCGVQKVFNGAVSDTREYFNKQLSEKGLPCWFEIIATPVKNKDGITTSVLELTVDITEKKRMQNLLLEYSQKLEKLVDERTEQLHHTQAKLVSSERLAAIGQLAGMVGHDIRNPLSGIKNAAYFLRKKQANFIGEDGNEMLTMIDVSVERANKIVNDLLEYSRELHLDLDDYSPKSLIDYLLLSVRVPKNIKVSEHVQDSPSVWVDQGKIERVFMNLINNAFEAMSAGGVLEINSCQVGENVEFSFADTGCGMSEDVLSRIFTPLFTTKAQGMGFGLAICKRIVEAHGGKISVKSCLKKGTTFIVDLPVDQKQNAFREKSRLM